MRTPTLAGGLGFSGLFAALGNQIGLPWQVYLTVALVIVFSVTAVAIVQQVMPQDSRDKLQLWTVVIKHRARRRETVAAAPRQALPSSARTARPPTHVRRQRKPSAQSRPPARSP